MSARDFFCSPEATATFRVLGYLGLAGFVGGSAFIAGVWKDGAGSRSAQRLLVIGVLAGLVGACGDIGCAILRLSSSMDARATLEQPFGRSFFALGLLWTLALVPLIAVLRDGTAAAHRAGWRLMVVIVGGALVFVNGETAHGAQTSPLGAVTDFVHVAAMSLWIGGLLMLVMGVLPRRDLDELDLVVPRFSKVAQAAVALVVLSGLAMLWEIVSGLPHFWGTHYADTVLTKIGILAATLAAAMLSRRWVLRRSSGARARPGLRSITASLLLESLGAVCVLAAAGSLATSSPGL